MAPVPGKSVRDAFFRREMKARMFGFANVEQLESSVEQAIQRR